jgi:hypothetical protein
MRKSTLLIALLAALTFTYAQNVVSIQDAKKASSNFLMERMVTTEAKSEPVLTLRQTVTDDAGAPLYYRFQIGDKGFVIVSATDVVAPVLAFSFESNYEENSAVEFLLGQYEKGIKLMKQYPEAADKNAQKAWKHYSMNTTDFKQSRTNTKDVILKSVEPLTTSNWDQGRYFNTLCPFNPYVSNSANLDNRVYTGCVAVAMSGLAYYYRYPNKSSKGYSYIPAIDDGTPPDNSHDPYEYPRITITAQQNFDYNAMTNTLNSYNNEVAKLMYNMGVSVDMGYGSESSGAQSEYAFEQMKLLWSYSKNAVIRQFSELNKYEEWASQVLKPELDAMRPLYYSGQPKAGGAGHAWLVDGYIEVDSANTYYHCNWGWGGYNNGFFKLGAFKSKLTAGGNEIVFDDHEAIFANLADSALCVNELAKPDNSFTRVTAHSGSISDGAGNVKYKPNSNRKWMIAAPNTASYTFNFDKIKTKNNDFITIYNGSTETSPVAGTYAGNYLMKDASDVSGTNNVSVTYPGTPLPSSLTVSKDSVLITFTSNSDDSTDYGFLIQYTSTLKSVPSSCSAVNSPITNNVGTITDKYNMSADQTKNYKPDNFCQWRVVPDGVVNYWVKFEKFDLKAGDYLDIYNINTTTKPWPIWRYDINYPPQIGVEFEMDCRKMRIDFLVDNKDEGSGFIMHFRPKETGIDDVLNNLYNVAVYPNPAKDRLNVELTTENTGNINFSIADITGKQILSETVKHAGGTMTYTTSVSSLSKGIYFISILTNQGKTVRKFIVE